jgi:hypothetical protein
MLEAKTYGTDTGGAGENIQSSMGDLAMDWKGTWSRHRRETTTADTCERGILQLQAEIG